MYFYFKTKILNKNLMFNFNKRNDNQDSISFLRDMNFWEVVFSNL